MDAATRRRKLRKTKILQNAEDRIRKLSGNFNGAVKHDENLDKQTGFNDDIGLILHERQNGNDCSSTKVDQNIRGASARGDKLCDGNDLSYQDKPTEVRDDYIKNVHETNKGDKATTHISYKEKIPDQNCPKNRDKSAEMQDKTDGKEILYHTDQLQSDDSGIEFDTGSEDVGSKTSINVRSMLVMILGTLCFTKSYFLPVISSILGSPWFLEIYSKEEVNMGCISGRENRGDIFRLHSTIVFCQR